MMFGILKKNYTRLFKCYDFFNFPIVELKHYNSHSFRVKQSIFLLSPIWDITNFSLGLLHLFPRGFEVCGYDERGGGSNNQSFAQYIILPNCCHFISLTTHFNLFMN